MTTEIEKQQRAEKFDQTVKKLGRGPNGPMRAYPKIIGNPKLTSTRNGIH